MRKYIFQKEITEKTVKTFKSIKKPLRCYMCGYHLQVGELLSVVNNNSYEGERGFHNFTVCERCDGDDVMKRWVEQCKEAKKKFWWLIEQ
jgi:hypothetical protein